MGFPCHCNETHDSGVPCGCAGPETAKIRIFEVVRHFWAICGVLEAWEASKHFLRIVYLLLPGNISAKTDQYSFHSCPKCVFLGQNPSQKNIFSLGEARKHIFLGQNQFSEISFLKSRVLGQVHPLQGHFFPPKK